MQQKVDLHFARPYLTIVVPFYNEEENVEAVCREIISVANTSASAMAFKNGWELIMVNDGSSDTTPSLMDALAREFAFCRAVHLAPNSGQSAALEAGFSRALGEVIATLDGDGQNDPSDLPGLIDKMAQLKVDMLCGIRAQRADGLIRKFSSRVANGLRARLLKDHISDVGCSLRVFRRSCLARIHFFRNAHRFFPALMIMAGYKVAETPVSHRQRLQGVSKYGLGINSRLWVGLADLAGVWWLQKRALRYELTEYQSSTPDRETSHE
ncbi:glycosyltransferase family 2 protein [Desulfocicer niacini]